MVASRSALLLAFALLSLTGCSICTNCEDEAYPTYGGIWQRTDRFHGRVGSVFAPAGAKIARPAALGDQTEPAVEAGDADDVQVVPPGTVDPDGDGERDRVLPEQTPSDEPMQSPESGEATEEARLEQPFGNPGYSEF